VHKKEGVFFTFTVGEGPTGKGRVKRTNLYRAGCTSDESRQGNGGDRFVIEEGKEPAEVFFVRGTLPKSGKSQ